MSRPATKGFQKPIDTGKRKPVGLAIITEGEVEGRKYASCSCGAPFTQIRDKVRNAAIDKHIEKVHRGKAIFL